MMRTLTPISSIIISILLLIFYVQPEYGKIAATQGEIDEYNKATEQYDAFTALLEQKLEVQRSRSAYESERLDLLAPDDIDTAQLLVDLERLAENQNMLFGNILIDEGEHTFVTRNENPGGETFEDAEDGRDALRTADISFSVIGTYEQFKNFLAGVERSVTLFEVIRIMFTGSEDEFQQYEVTVRVYALQN